MDGVAIRSRPLPTPRPVKVAVDVFIPTYNEPVEVVEPTVAAAMALHGYDVRVALLDNGGRPEMAAMAQRHGARYIQRAEHHGAKAGNINHALGLTDAPFVAVLDCDHVPDPAFLETCLMAFDAPRVALVQTPQYYANWTRGGIAEASWAQQSLFFGTIAQGRDTSSAPCSAVGTSVVFHGPPSTPPVASRPTRSPRTSSCRSACTSRAGRPATCPRCWRRGWGPRTPART